MGHYITTFQYTEAGKKGLLSDPNDRGFVVAGMLEKLGAKMIGMYVTMGANEVVIISEGDDAAHLKAIAMIAEASGSIGSITSTPAWTTLEFVDICKTAGAASGAYAPPGA